MADFGGGLTQNTVVKACYSDNSELNYASSAAQMQYETEFVDYNRLGTSTTYEITIEVTRGNVPRMGKPALKIQYIANTSAVFLYEPIQNVDVTTFTFYPTTSVNQVICEVVDFWDIDVYKRQLP